MKKLNTPDEIVVEVNKMNKENSVLQFLLPERGKFTLVFQEEDKTAHDKTK
ncbi:hypothetical protein QGM71_20695 [Virgibacillus sp. C22-A2]|uniref:Uncharacterized protein n=1 Tax=Virgibacillus tibetensis TaxID=3042313 RepID=A0ABU6KKR5_9BACI|nr:hypothetical protein [Virgibacillus sp. C22-A2]